ncbi:MAG: ABC transporter substrate-binding protein, partial [Dehalococcoidia bacterium]|nr:ABC transporter substrate-binding protein [Dehalococcoidia bacterium]
AAPVAPAAPAARPTAAAPATATPERPRYGGVLTITSDLDPPHFDAQQQTSMNIGLLVSPAYSNLLYYDAETGSKIVPELAEQWNVSPDALTYTFKLRKGVKFHDGTPLTPADVVFSLERMKSPPKGGLSASADLLVAMDKVQAVGDDTVTLTMKYAFAPLVSTLVVNFTPIFSKAYVEKNGDMKTTVMGSGPFKFKSYTPSVSFDLVKNESYWVQGRPYLDGISVFVIKDPATRLAALRTGQAKQSGRTYSAVTPTEMETLKKEVPGMRFVASPTVLGPWFFMNMRNAPLKDLRVRQAISLSLDRQAAVKVVGEGAGIVGTYFPFSDWGIPRDELLKMPGFRQPKDQDIADAKKLLADAGYPNGFSMTILSRGNQVTKTGAVFMTDQLSKIGITANVQVLEDAVFWENGRKAQHQAMVYPPATLTADPHAIGRFFTKGSSLNFSGNDNDTKVNELWDKQARTVDPAARQAIIVEVERYLLTESLPAIPIAWPSNFIAISAQERGFAPGVTDYSNNRHQETWLAQ